MQISKPLLYFFSLLTLPLIGCQNTVPGGGEARFRTTLDSVSYSIGYSLGSSMAADGLDELNLQNLNAGMLDAFGGSDARLTEMERMSSIQNYQAVLQQKQSERMERLAGENQAEGERFLSENAGKEGVSVTESGLQYRVIEEGSGRQPKAESTVEVHYRGSLLNGQVFDSSYERGEPARFPLNQVIPGWTEGVQLMKEGSKYEFYIPSELGYGLYPPPGSPIEPGSVLIFEVELLSVED